MIRFFKHAVRTAKALAHDRRIPKWLRYALVFTILPILGPVDDVLAPIVMTIIAIRYHAIVAETWRGTAMYKSRTT